MRFKQKIFLTPETEHKTSWIGSTTSTYHKIEVNIYDNYVQHNESKVAKWKLNLFLN